MNTKLKTHELDINSHEVVKGYEQSRGKSVL